MSVRGDTARVLDGRAVASRTCLIGGVEVDAQHVATRRGSGARHPIPRTGSDRGVPFGWFLRATPGRSRSAFGERVNQNCKRQPSSDNIVTVGRWVRPIGLTQCREATRVSPLEALRRKDRGTALRPARKKRFRMIAKFGRSEGWMALPGRPLR
jgi:hypothetical protein